MMTPSENHAPPGLRGSEPFVSAHTRAMIVVALFAAYIVLAVFSAASSLLLFFTNPVILAAEEGMDEPLTLYDLLQMLSGLGILLVFIVLVVFFLMWLHRVCKNLPALGNVKQRIEYSPGWAVGSFFVPFVNLVVPYKAVKEVWEKSDPAVRGEGNLTFSAPSSAPSLLLGWWIFWLVSNFASNLSWRLQGKEMTSESLNAVAGVDLVANILSVIAAALAILVVRDIDRRQTERARHVSYVGNLPPPPPIFRPQPAAVPGGTHAAPPPQSGFER
ncbi:MAG: DUF4328 domain-containing protein [Pyrinomonadaceae bacterium]